MAIAVETDADWLVKMLLRYRQRVVGTVTTEHVATAPEQTHKHIQVSGSSVVLLFSNLKQIGINLNTTYNTQSFKVVTSVGAEKSCEETSHYWSVTCQPHTHTHTHTLKPGFHYLSSRAEARAVNSARELG